MAWPALTACGARCLPLCTADGSQWWHHAAQPCPANHPAARSGSRNLRACMAPAQALSALLPAPAAPNAHGSAGSLVLPVPGPGLPRLNSCSEPARQALPADQTSQRRTRSLFSRP